MLLTLSSNGSRFDNSSRLLRMVFPTPGGSHDFNVPSSIYFRECRKYLAGRFTHQTSPNHSHLMPINLQITKSARSNQPLRQNSLRSLRKVPRNVQIVVQPLQPREYRNCSYGTQQRQGPSRTSLKGKISFQDFCDTYPSKLKRKERQKEKKGLGKNRDEGRREKQERRERKEEQERKQMKLREIQERKQRKDE